MSTNKKITDLPELTELNLADDDVLAIVDVSAGTTNKVQKSVLASALSGVSVVNATSPIAVDQTTGEVTVSISATPSFGTVDLTADTSTGDTAAVGYTSAEGIIITGQGSSNDITLKNDADAVALKVPTGTTNVTVTGVASAASFTGSGAGLTAGTIPITTLDIDGGTDIGAAIVDADLFIIDDGASGTNRKTAASRLKTYIGAGDVTGPGSATDNTAARFDSTTGKLIQGSGVTIDDSNNVGAASLTLTTDLAVEHGGTGASTLTDGGVLLGSGTGAVTAMAVLADGEMIVGDGTTDPVAESGATLRTSIGVGTGDTVTVTSLVSSASSYIGDTANADSTLGLTINQGAADDEILGLKSSDITQPYTDLAETDTYGFFKKEEATGGGLNVSGFSDTGGKAGVQIKSYSHNRASAFSTTAEAAMEVWGYGRTSNGIGNSGATDVIFGVGTQVGGADQKQFLVDASGAGWFRGAIELGNPTDTTLARSGAGDVTIEGNAIYRAGGTDVPVADGGTGASTHTANSVLIGEGTSAISSVAPSTSGNVLTSDGTNWTSAAASSSGGIAFGTANSPTSSSVTFTGIPAGTNRIEIIYAGITWGTSDALYSQLGDSGGIETSGYLASAGSYTESVEATVGFRHHNNGMTSQGAACLIQYSRVSGNTWVMHSVSRGNLTNAAAGSKTLSGELTQLKVYSFLGNNMTAGTIQISYQT